MSKFILLFEGTTVTSETFRVAVSILNHCMKEIKFKISQNLVKSNPNFKNDTENEIDSTKTMETEVEANDKMNQEICGEAEIKKSKIKTNIVKKTQHFELFLEECSDEEKRKWMTLKDSLIEISSLLAAAIFERIYIQINYSVRALLSILHELEDSIVRQEEFSNLADLIVSTIR